MKCHPLQTDPEPFQNVWRGLQTFQIRPDNDYQVGEALTLQETVFDTERDGPQGAVRYTGREIHADISHIMRGPKYGLSAGWVCMSISVFFKVRINADSR